jgi:hypothetical protein
MVDPIGFLNTNAGAAQSVSAAASVFISILILLVYRKQNQIESVQHEAAVSIEKFRKYDKPDSIEIVVSNFGDGAAKNLTGVISPELTEDGKASLGPQTEVSLQDTEVSLDRKDILENPDWEVVSGSSLGPRQSGESFVLQSTLDLKGHNKVSGQGLPIIGGLVDYIHFEVCSNERNRIPVFRDAIETLLEEDIDRLKLRISIRYRDGLKNENYEPVMEYVIPIVENTDLSEAFENGCDIQEYQRNPESFEEDIARMRLNADEE